MATELPVWISSAALVVSLASFGVSAYVARINVRITKTQKRMELLTKLREVHIQYSELNRRYATLCKNFRSVPADLLEKLLKYKEYEKLTNGYYDFVADKDLSATEAEEWRHHIESMLLHIASDNRRIDEWEKGQSKREN
jgi:hypothetical protein